MSIKKTLMIAAGAASCLAAGAVIAGGGNNVACAQPAAFAPFFYVGANGGMAYHAMSNETGVLSSTATYTKGANWGYTLGGNLGYNFTQHLGAEFGGNWVSSTQVTDTSGPSVQTFGSRWFLYGAGTLRALVYDNFTLVGKFGVAWNNLKVSTAPADSGDGSATAWGSVLGLEGQYDFGNNVYMTAQWLHVDVRRDGNATGSGASARNSILAKDLLTVGVGYKFNV